MNIEQITQDILSNVQDPSTQLTAQKLGLKPSISQRANTLDIKLRAGFPIKSLEQSLLPKLNEAFKKKLPDFNVQLTLDSFIQSHQTQLPGKGLRNVKNVIAVGSGKGGVGKSTVTIHLATQLAAEGARVGILDADIYGPSIPTMLGKTAPITFKEERYVPANAHGIQAMSIGYLTPQDDALIWRGPMLAKALIQMLDITEWDNLDYLFIDLPPGTGDIQLSLVQKIPLAGAIIVTTPQTVATQDAQKALKMFEKTNINILGIVENMSQHICTQCGHKDAIFGMGGAQILCQQHQLNLLGQLPLNTEIATQCDQGEPITQGIVGKAFLNLALATSIELSKRPLNYESKFPPIVVMGE